MCLLAYGTGQNSSPRRNILHTIVIPCQSECGSSVHIRHLVLEGSSQWVIGQNVTGSGDIRQSSSPALVVGKDGNNLVSLNLIKKHSLLYIQRSDFDKNLIHMKTTLESKHNSSTTATNTSSQIFNTSWLNMKKLLIVFIGTHVDMAGFLISIRFYYGTIYGMMMPTSI